MERIKHTSREPPQSAIEAFVIVYVTISKAETSGAGNRCSMGHAARLIEDLFSAPDFLSDPVLLTGNPHGWLGNPTDDGRDFEPDQPLQFYPWDR
jgi:hypothetical protein